VVFGQTLRAQSPAVDGMAGVALDGDGLAVSDPDQHPAADRAVPARRGDPRVGSPRRRHRPAIVGLGHVGVPVAAVVEAEERGDALHLPDSPTLTDLTVGAWHQPSGPTAGWSANR